MVHSSLRAIRLACFSASKALPWAASSHKLAFGTSRIPNTADLTSPIEESDASNMILQIPTETMLSSARPVETRKSQLIRTYTSLLRTTPLILFFQHSNLTAVEWAAVRRELRRAIDAVSEPLESGSSTIQNASSQVQLQILRTNMLAVALKIVEFHQPTAPDVLKFTRRSHHKLLAHDLSKVAYKNIQEAAITSNSAFAHLQTVMVGPLAALVLPAVSPPHLAAALSVLAPIAGIFPAPSRRKHAGYYDPICQNGLSKLLLVGARVEGKVLDRSGVHWVGGVQGGLDGMRSELVSTLQSAGFSVTTALSSGSKSLWLALEGRTTQLEGNEP
ncbi:hypothetical protein AAL_04453 [Moelleriella libera RCEF 2490]|uniref:Uncharacterized protein n=1 Tax=Moelleriella libera RCEF 2490 TaxID=1081109 RepID=A0A168C5B8_9HYPO|nr:hypothetical protein AAL_04453 [Moelleriella libera RCEF 2490]